MRRLEDFHTANTQLVGLRAEVENEKKKNSDLEKKALQEKTNNEAATNQIDALSKSQSPLLTEGEGLTIDIASSRIKWTGLTGSLSQTTSAIRAALIVPLLKDEAVLGATAVLAVVATPRLPAAMALSANGITLRLQKLTLRTEKSSCARDGQASPATPTHRRHSIIAGPS